MTAVAPETKPPSSLFTAGRTGIRLSVAVGWARALLGAGAVTLIGRVIDLVVAGDSPASHLIWVGALLMIRALISVVPPLAATTTATNVESDLRRRVVHAALSIGQWRGRRTGDLVAKATEGVAAVGALAGTFLPQLISGMSIPIILAIVVATIDWPTALVLVLVLPMVPLLLRLLEKRFASVSTRYRETADQLAARFLDGIQGLRTLKALDRADAYGDEIAVDAERLRGETMGLLRVNQLALLAVDTLFTLGTVVATAAMAAIRLRAGAVSVGEAVAIVLLGVMLIEPLGQIGRFFYVGAIGRASAAQLRELFAMAEPVDETPAPTSLVESGVIQFDQVTFTYPDGTKAIDNVTFRVDEGERIALVGPSGAGKTTIAHLILGLVRPQQGAVGVGGRAVLVPQRPFLFHGSVADNLRLARPDASDSELWAVLEIADLAELVSRRPDGLATQVGERGLQLSGGEVQRLAVARALLVDAPVVVFDEPTSNVDLESEARMRAAINRLTTGRTVVIIAHRRSTIAGVDRALVIEKGRLVRTMSGPEAGSRLSKTSRGGAS